jgi:hypothetical protein
MFWQYENMTIPFVNMSFQKNFVLPARWEHPGVTQKQRRNLVGEAFDQIRIRDGKPFAVKPRPLFLSVSKKLISQLVVEAQFGLVAGVF